MLTLTIEGSDTLDNGQATRFELDRHGAMVGRSPHADWSLPDASNLISSKHCEINYRDGDYLLVDHSTNGTFVNEAEDRLRGPHPIVDGDRIRIGHYAIVARRARAEAASVDAPSQHEIAGWDQFAPASPPPGKDDAGWAAAPEPATGWNGRWNPVELPQGRPVPSGTWDLPAPLSPPSPWCSEPSQASQPIADDIWGRLSRESEIDWPRDFAGGPLRDTGRVAAPPPPPPPPPPSPSPSTSATPTQPASLVPRVVPPAAVPDDLWPAFVSASGMPADRIDRPAVDVIAKAGAVLRQMASGLILMLEARARTKGQMGVQATGLELDGNNPLKFMRAPERALLQMLAGDDSGFMPAERAVEDAFQDLQAHQMAMLSAMRTALRGTLAHFAPDAVRDRVGEPKGLARHLSILHRARQWDAYERAFEGFVRGADDAFMDLFAKAFRQSYEQHIADMKASRRGTGAPE